MKQWERPVLSILGIESTQTELSGPSFDNAPRFNDQPTFLDRTTGSSIGITTPGAIGIGDIAS